MFLAGAFIGVAIPLLPKSGQKWSAGILASILIITSAIWAGYEIAIMESAGDVSKPSTIDIDEVLANIVPGNGGIEVAASWWKAIDAKDKNGDYDPTAFPGNDDCFGVAWNAMGLDHTVVTFQSKQSLEFQPGGQYSLICLTENVKLSARDVGRIQATWLSREHGGTWRVQVLD